MYRLEIDALNALVKEQKRTNELLEQLLEDKTQRGKRSANKSA